MKRRAPKEWRHYAWTEYQAFRDIDQEKLALIGAIALEWNFIEDMLDAMPCIAMNISADLWDDVTTRINGAENRAEVTKAALKSLPMARPEDGRLLEETIGQALYLKKLRDGVVHARIYAPDADVGITSKKRGESDEILLTSDALNILHQHTSAMADEISKALNFLEHLSFASWELKPEGDVDPNEVRASAGFQDARALLQHHQRIRRSLPQLPKFPDEHLVPPRLAVTPKLRD